jgi:hypothetical protein
MDAAFSFLISIGIIAFGIWMVAATIAIGSPWALIDYLPFLWGRSAFIKQLAISRSRSLSRSRLCFRFPARAR